MRRRPNRYRTKNQTTTEQLLNEDPLIEGKPDVALAVNKTVLIFD
jgi:hypothetical protein